MIVYVSIGNSDDKLTQAMWSKFHFSVDDLLRRHGRVHGAWTSGTADAWQNACWCLEFDDEELPTLKWGLVELGRLFRQDSIAWAEAPETEFL